MARANECDLINERIARRGTLRDCKHQLAWCLVPDVPMPFPEAVGVLLPDDHILNRDLRRAARALKRQLRGADLVRRIAHQLGFDRGERRATQSSLEDHLAPELLDVL